MMNNFGFYILSYLLGSIPFGYIFTKISAGRDITKEGSGNIGATNVMRVLGKKFAALTLLCDASKGMIAIIVSHYCFGIDSEIEIYKIALFAVIGHMFPIWLKFKGGKGVATGGAILTLINPIIGSMVILAWVLIFAISRISSVSSIVASSLAPIFAFYLYKDSNLPLFCFMLSSLIIVKHIGNIKRLLSGNESSFGKAKK